ncbi:hypothetical protein D3C73_1429500 [compost metagenome]
MFWGIKQDYKFDLDKFVDELGDYLTSSITVKRYHAPYEQWMLYGSDLAFGLEIYDNLINYMTKVNNKYDLRPFYVLWEHKKLMPGFEMHISGCPTEEGES